MKTIEEMKELYATGEWEYIVKHGKNWHKESEYPAYASIFERKLIHKKHYDALAHVLNGGEVDGHEPLDNNGIVVCIGKLKAEEFINTYSEDNEYILIKDKPSLNGHYCLATKEHYDKLVEDGYADYADDSNEAFFAVFKSKFTDVTNRPSNQKPMHLHSNEWVFNSLEHEGDNPKPVERISREEFKEKINKSTLAMNEEGKYGDYVYKDTVYVESLALFDYIEYLESNQKENS